MADNQYVNRVDWNGGTLIDLTTDDVSRADVALGKVFHLPSGEQTTGTASGGGEYNVTSIIDSDDKQHIYIEDAGAEPVYGNYIAIRGWREGEEEIYGTTFHKSANSDGYVANQFTIAPYSSAYFCNGARLNSEVYVVFNDQSYFNSKLFTAESNCIVERVTVSASFGYLKIIQTGDGAIVQMTNA